MAATLPPGRQFDFADASHATRRGADRFCVMVAHGRNEQQLRRGRLAELDESLLDRTPPALFEQGRQPVIPVRQLDTDGALRMVVGQRYGFVPPRLGALAVVGGV